MTLRPVRDHGYDPAESRWPQRDQARARIVELQDGLSDLNWLRDRLGGAELPGVFLRGGRLVYVASVGEDGYIPPRHHEGDNGPATIINLSALGLSTRVGDVYTPRTWDKKNRQWETVHFPKDTCERALETVDTLPHVRPLRGVCHTPIAGLDRGLLTKPGYDDDSGFLFEPHVDIGNLHLNPTDDQVRAATTYLRGLVSEFIWGDRNDNGSSDSEANFWGAMLTPLLRLPCPPPYKLTAVTARERGSGKTLLATLLKIVHGGAVSPWPTNEDEVHKVISSKLYCTTAPVQIMDNIRGTLTSARLEALATSATYDVRVLGSTNEHSLQNDRLWVFTANNMIIGGDLGRRMMWIDIDPGQPKPETRDHFRIPDLAAFCTQNRGDILRALLTWVAAWDSRGRIVGPTTSDSYGKWTAVVRAILDVAGVPGTFNNPDHDQTEVANPEEVEWADFLAVARGHYAGELWTVKAMTQHMEGEAGHALLEALPDELHHKAAGPAGPAGIRKSLGKWLGFRQGQWHGGFTVRPSDKLEPGTKSKRWQVIAESEVNDGA